MFGSRWRVIRLLGIPISVDPSWLITLALLTLSLATGFPAMLQQYFPGTSRGLSPVQYWLLGLATSLVFFGCILLHEMGHAVVARARGMKIRGITLFLFGGVAELGGEPPSAATEFWMAIAGPVVSLVISLFFWLCAAAASYAGLSHVVVLVLGYLAGINALVLVFNLMPAFPLDGGRVFRSILWSATGNLRKATAWASRMGQGLAWVLFGLALLQFFGGNWLGGIWIGLMGLFLDHAARSSYQDLLVKQVLEGVAVSSFMTPSPIAVPAELDLATWVDDYVFHYHRKRFPVVSHGRLVGLVRTAALGRIPRSEWSLHTVSDVMERDLEFLRIPPRTDALDALGRMQQSGATSLLVAEGDRLVGVISLSDLLQYLDLKLDLEGVDDLGEGIAARDDWHSPVGAGRGS